MNDYTIVSWLLTAINAMLAHWYIYALCTLALWAMFAFKIRKVHILQLADFMPGEDCTEAEKDIQA